MSIWQFLLLRVALPLHYGCLRAALHQLLHILSLYYAFTALDTALWKKGQLQLSATAARSPRQCYRRGLGGVRASGLGCGESDTQCDSESETN